MRTQCDSAPVGGETVYHGDTRKSTEHFFKTNENRGRAYEILKKNGVPTEYHILKGTRHFDVYGGTHLEKVMKIEIR